MARAGFIQSDMDFKLLVLYIMDHAAAPVTFLQILELALCDAGVDYFSLHQAVGHLVERKNLKLEDDKYSITEKGRRNSAICESGLPASVRRRCDENLLHLNRIMIREQQVQGQVFSNEDGTATVHLQLSDDGGPLLELKILSPSPEAGAEMVSLYKSRPEATYHNMMQLLAAPEENT